MPWHFGIPAVLLVWLLLVSPAGAALERHTDAQGVIHITNLPPKASEAETPAAASPTPQPALQQPASVTPSAPSLAAVDLEIRNGSRSKDLARLTRILLSLEGYNATIIHNHSDCGAQATVISYQTEAEQLARALQSKVFPWAGLEESDQLQKDVALKVLLGNDCLAQSRFMARINGDEPEVAAAAPQQAAARPAESTSPANTGKFSGPLPVQKVAYEPPAPAAAPRLTAAPPASSTTPGGIRRYRDAQGVWHITNAAPPAAEGGPALLTAENRAMPKTAAPTAPYGRPAAVASALPFQKVSWNPEFPDLVNLPVSKPAPKTLGTEGPGLTRRYRDRQGVIHIVNVEPENPGSRMAADLPLPARLPNHVPRHGPVSLVAAEVSGPLAWKQAAWSGDTGFNPPAVIQVAARRQGESVTEGGIHRWRDKKGVWHIKTEEYPRPDLLARPPALNTLPSAAAPVAPPTAEAPAGPPVATAPPPLAVSRQPVPTITAFKDGKGRLKITTETPTMAALPQAAPKAGAVAPPELEPVIIEAAIIYRLPASLIRAVIKVESNFCVGAVSPKGAMGLMQLMPGTAAFLGVQEPFNPRQNVLGGCSYLRLLVDYFAGNVPLALAGYNAGFQRVVNCGFQVPPIKETQDFVTQVMGRYLSEEKKARLPWT